MPDESASPLILATAEALTAGEDLRIAVVAAAELLKDCTCQERRRAESIAACKLADNACARWISATSRMMRIARARENPK